MVSNPLKDMKVNWDDYSQCTEKLKKQTYQIYQIYQIKSAGPSSFCCMNPSASCPGSNLSCSHVGSGDCARYQRSLTKDKTRGGCETQRVAILVRLYYCFLSCFFTYSTRGKGIRNSGVGDACLHRRKRTYALSSTSFSAGFPAKRETSASLICESSIV